MKLREALGKTREKLPKSAKEAGFNGDMGEVYKTTKE